jgi:hypothetical protein
MVLRRISIEQSRVWLKTLASNPGTLPSPLQAAEVIGDPPIIPWRRQQMASPIVARVAGESFTFLMGVDLAYEDLERRKAGRL